jgi:hypothetical protein
MKLLHATLILPLFAGIVSADTVILKNGDRITGTFVSGTTRQIRLDTPSGVQTIEIERVQSIQFDEAGPPAPAVAPRSRAIDPVAPRSLQTAPAPNTAGLTIPADTVVSIRMIDSVDSDRARVGQTFRASLDEPIVVNGEQVVGRNADVLCKLVRDDQAGRLAGRDVITLALSTIEINGRTVEVTSTDVTMSSGSQTSRTAKAAGGTAALGAIIGAIAGGGKGAAIGAGAGAAAGAGTSAVMKGQSVKIPSETRLTFRLQQPVRI